MRSAIAAGAEPDGAITAYFVRMANTDPQDLHTLTALTTPQAPSTFYGWQTELEATKTRFSRLVNAPHDTPIGYTIAALVSLPNLPDTPGEVTQMVDLADRMETVAGPAAALGGARGSGSDALGAPREPSDPLFPTVPSARSAPMVQEPPGSRNPVAPGSLDVRAPGAQPWLGVLDDAARGLAPPPEPFTVEPWVVKPFPMTPAERPTVTSMRPPVPSKVKYSTAGNLLALWNSRWQRVDPMSKDDRKRLGYNIPSDKGFEAALYDHWKERGLAKKLPDGSWELFDIMRDTWFPKSMIDRGHVLGCVEHNQMMVQRFGSEATRTPADERRRQQIVKTFMRDLDNYLPQLDEANRGAKTPWTYRGTYPDFRIGGQGITELPTGERLRTVDE
jgi:hypothetical protein